MSEQKRVPRRERGVKSASQRAARAAAMMSLLGRNPASAVVALAHGYFALQASAVRKRKART